MMRYTLVLAACLSLAAAESSNNKLLLQRLERILEEERAVQESAVQEITVQEKSLHKDGPERRVAITAAITAAAASGLGKALENAEIKLDVNKAMETLIRVFTFDGPEKSALILNGDDKGHQFYVYNSLDYVYWASASKPYAGSGGVAEVNKNTGWGKTMKVYVDDKKPQYIVKADKTYVYTPTKGMTPVDMSAFKGVTTKK